jgi:hypothetical protein
MCEAVDPIHCLKKKRRKEYPPVATAGCGSGVKTEYLFSWYIQIFIYEQKSGNEGVTYTINTFVWVKK